MNINLPVIRQQRGFILVTALIMLSLLMLMSLAMFFASRSATQTSATAQKSTEAYYYAETAINYISWGLANDAEFDSFKYTGSYIAPKFDEPSLNLRVPSNAPSVGDHSELRAYMWDPGPTGIAGPAATDSATRDTAYTAGQVMYFDNSPMDSRTICFQSVTKFKKCIDVTALKPNKPSMYQISTKLPRYIKLDIAPDGTISPSIPKLPHRGPTSTPIAGPVVENNQKADGTYDHNGDIPRNGAIAWITAADLSNPKHDIEIYPLDPKKIFVPPDGAFGPSSTAPSACTGGSLPNCPCDSSKNVADNKFSTANACDANSGKWLPDYSIVVYAIGYVNGKPDHMLRAIIQ